MQFCRVCVVLSCLLLCIYCKNDDNNMEEKQLIKKLLRRYKEMGVDGRPVYNVSDTVTVKFGVSVKRLFLSDKENTLTLEGFASLTWKDPLLTWNPEDYSDLFKREIRLSLNSVWKPDLQLMNGESKYEETLATVSHDGTIRWFPVVTYTAHCQPNVTYFPYDHHECQLTFLSWGYTGFELNLELYYSEGMDMDNAVSPWVILGNTGRRNVQYYACCVEPYPDLTYKLILARKSGPLEHTILLPAILFSVLSIVIFVLPPDSDSRKLFGLGLVMCFFVIINLISERLSDESEQIPKLVVHLTVQMFLVMIVLLLSVFVEFINGLGSRGIKLPCCFKGFVWKIGKLVCVGRQASGTRQSREYGNQAESASDNSPHDFPLMPNNDIYHDNSLYYNVVARENQIREWNIVARVLDNTFFLTYFVVIVMLWFWFLKDMLVTNNIWTGESFSRD